MSDTAHHFKVHQYFYDEKDKKVYHILEKEECRKTGHNVKFVVQDLENFKHSTKSYSHDHHLRLVDVHTRHYTLSHFRDEEDGFYLELFDTEMKPRGDLHLHDASLIEQVTKAYKALGDDDKPLNVKVVQVKVGALHRVDKSLNLEQVVQITGVDFSHLHDHHHQHHHQHSTT